MARRMPTAAEYRNAQRVTGMRDVDIADVRDITRRGLKAPAPAPARKRGKVRSRKRIVTQSKPKPTPKPTLTPAQKVAGLKASRPDSRPTADEMDVLGRAGGTPPVSNKPLAVQQKVKVDEHGGASANDAPKAKSVEATPSNSKPRRAAQAAIAGAGLTGFTSVGTALAHKTRQGHNALGVLMNGVPPKWVGQSYKMLNKQAAAKVWQGMGRHVARNAKAVGLAGLGATAVGGMADYMEKKHPRFSEIYEEVHKKVRGKGNT